MEWEEERLDLCSIASIKGAGFVTFGGQKTQIDKFRCKNDTYLLRISKKGAIFVSERHD